MIMCDLFHHNIVHVQALKRFNTNFTYFIFVNSKQLIAKTMYNLINPCLILIWFGEV